MVSSLLFEENHSESTAKYESPYGAEPRINEAQRSSLSPGKRPHSNAVAEDQATEAKRQRIMPQPAPVVPLDDDFDRMLSEAAELATATATQEGAYNQSISYDMTAMAGIMPNYQDHQGNQETMTNGGPDTGPMNSLFFTDPHLTMKINTLPCLYALAVQIVAKFSQLSSEEAANLFTGSQTDQRQTYTILKDQLDSIKKIYAKDWFLAADELNMTNKREMIRIINLATFLPSVYSGNGVGFWELDTYFLSVLVEHGAQVPKAVADLHLNLKTQIFISAISQEEPESTKEEVLDHLFPQSLSDILQARHPDSVLSQDEVEFVNNAISRCDLLKKASEDLDDIPRISEHFAWDTFLRDLSAHLKETCEPLGPYMKQNGLVFPAVSQQSSNEHNGEAETKKKTKQDVDLDPNFMNAIAEAEQESLRNMCGSYTDSYPPHQQQGSAMQNCYLPESYAAVPFPTQTAPTQILYERARQIAVAKSSSPHSRRPGFQSQRRPWSTEEENALMTGLDKVKGPHWSQILALYGVKGQVSDVLKERNQVQLKDKARNLKLFFLKSNIEVPYYLQSVTGELKTRAPSQAARKEAEERARLGTEEEQGIGGRMTQNGGLQGQKEQDNGTPPRSQRYSPTTAQQSYQPVRDQTPPQIHFDGSTNIPEGKGKSASRTVSPQPQQSSPAELDFEGELGQRLKESMAQEMGGPQASPLSSYVTSSS